MQSGRGVLSYLGAHRRMLAVGTCFLLTTNALERTIPWLLKNGVDAFGAWAGRAYADIVAADPAAAAFFADPAAADPPGGEPAAAVAARVLAELADLAGDDDAASSVVVGHAGSLRLALAAALGIPFVASWRLRLDCAGLSVLGWAAGGPTIERLNDTGHLGGFAEGEGSG